MLKEILFLSTSENLLNPMVSVDNSLTPSFSMVSVLYLNRMKLNWSQVSSAYVSCTAVKDS